MTWAKWTRLPHCQYGVVVGGFMGEPYDVACGSPAAHLAQWGEEQGLYLCDEHAALVEESEEEVQLEVRP